MITSWGAKHIVSQHHKDYVWKRGLPFGVQAYPENTPLEGVTYKIVSDPYFKRNSVEEYLGDSFSRTLYDSALFDFRQLRQGEQQVWQKMPISENSDAAVCHIRNQDDRLVLIEEYTFEGQRCRKCLAYSPQRILISVQLIYFTALQDSFNGVILFDANDHPVMLKKYTLDDNTQEFSQLLEEQWDGALLRGIEKSKAFAKEDLAKKLD